MTRIYVILTVVGWIWCAVVLAYLFIRLRKGRMQQRFDFVETHEEQS